MLRDFRFILCLLVAGVLPALSARGAQETNWPNWEKYRAGVQAPAGAIKAADLVRARENLRRYDWAKEYLQTLRTQTDPWLSQIQASFLEQMIPQTTPGGVGFTPCPACRDLGKPYVPHGNWDWAPDNPDVLKCKVCKTIFPNEKYPESVVLKTNWGKPQTLTFYGGEPFKVFDYNGLVRPSFTGNIRARKVAWMASLVNQLGEVYALSGEEKYALATRSILLRFAAVYPHWLLHIGYGEYVDMEPRLAARSIEKLPKDELLTPPNKPNQTLFKTFWTAGRSGGSGGDSLFVIPVATAYDLTRNAKNGAQDVYSESERRTIEKNLLLESTFHLVADKKINNKSVGNRSAAAMVGMIVGEPELVRFGIEGFNLTVNDWFLPDGSTPESPAYALMTVGRMTDFVNALRGYTDPPGYKDAQGKRYDNFNPYRDTNYGKVGEALFKTLQGDLLYPPFADSYVTTTLRSGYAETLAAAYPERAEYAALLKALLKDDWNNAVAADAIYLAEPGRENRELSPLVLADYLPPDLRIGFMRTGASGRESLLTLSASHWGGHHHLDSLNLYYWKQGKELLSDLGYLWDHPDRSKTKRTLAHNTVMIDEAEQRSKERGGDVKYFLSTPNVKAMRASSTPYEHATTYERASTLIDHGDGQNYVVDVFWAQGGKTQDFIFHGPNNDFKVDAVTNPDAAQTYDFKNVRRINAKAETAWRATWNVGKQLQFTAWNLPQDGEAALLGDGWGQRQYNNSDRGATLPYFVRRTSKTDLSTFVSLFEGYAPGQSMVQNITRLKVPNAIAPVTALRIETKKGRDYVVCSQAPQSLSIATSDGVLKCNAALAVVSVQDGKTIFVAGDPTASIN